MSKRSQIEETPFEKAYKASLNDFSKLDAPVGFELFRQYRDDFINAIVSQGKGEYFLNARSNFCSVGDLDLFDPAYLDNIYICIQLYIFDREGYSKNSQIIDRYIKPDIRSSGLQIAKKELACLFVHILNIYANISIRQSTNLAKQVFLVAESEIKRRLPIIQEKYKQWKKDQPPPLLILTMVFGYLAYFKHVDFYQTKSVSPHTTLTQKSHRDVLLSYKKFKKETGSFYIKKNIDFIKKYSNEIHATFSDEGELLEFINFKKYDLDNLDENHFWAILLFATTIDLMPNLLLSAKDFVKKT